MSGFLRPRNIAIGVGAGAALLAFSQTRTAQKLDPVRNPIKTPAVSSVTDRFSKAGGSENGTPAIASPLGSAEKQHTPHSHENTVAGANPSGGKSPRTSKQEQSSGTPGKEQKHEGSEGANVNAVDRKGQTGREGSHGNLRDIKTSQAG